MVPLQMELGGKDACIVLEDADLDLVASNVIKGGFSYRCVNIFWFCHMLHELYPSLGIVKSLEIIFLGPPSS